MTNEQMVERLGEVLTRLGLRCIDIDRATAPVATKKQQVAETVIDALNDVVALIAEREAGQP